jgi:hypothetical protein
VPTIRQLFHACEVENGETSESICVGYDNHMGSGDLLVCLSVLLRFVVNLQSVSQILVIGVQRKQSLYD